MKNKIIKLIIILGVLVSLLVLVLSPLNKSKTVETKDKAGETTESVKISVADRWSDREVINVLNTMSSDDSTNLDIDTQILQDINSEIIKKVEEYEKTSSSSDMNDLIITLLDSKGEPMDLHLNNSTVPISLVNHAQAAEAYLRKPYVEITISRHIDIDRLVALFSGVGYSEIAINGLFLKGISNNVELKNYLLAGYVDVDDNSALKSPLKILLPLDLFETKRGQIDDFGKFNPNKSAEVSYFESFTTSGIDDPGLKIKITPMKSLNSEYIANILDGFSLSNWSISRDYLEKEDYPASKSVRLSEFKNQETLKRFLSRHGFEKRDPGKAFAFYTLLPPSALYKQEIEKRLNSAKEAGFLDYEVTEQYLFIPNYLYEKYRISSKDLNRRLLFGETVPKEMEDVFVKAYEDIYHIVGKRERTGPLKVRVEGACSSINAWYFTAADTVAFCKNTLDHGTIAHEITHSFFGWLNFYMPLIWVEGPAVTISEYVLGYSNIDSSTDNRVKLAFENDQTTNVPFMPEPRVSRLYNYGGLMFTKLFIEDKEIFRKFKDQTSSVISQNLKEVRALNNKESKNSFMIGKIMMPIITKIEGMSASEWYSRRFVFTKLNNNKNKDGWSDQSIYALGNNYKKIDVGGRYFSDLYSSIFTNTDTSTLVVETEFDFAMKKNKFFNLKVSDYEDKILFDKQKVKLESDIEYTYTELKLPPDYEGLIKIEFIPEIGTKGYVQYFAKINRPTSDDAIYGLVFDASDGDLVDIDAELQDQLGRPLAPQKFKATNIPIKNGMFIVKDETAKKAGRFNVTIKKRKIKLTETDYVEEFEYKKSTFNKIAMDGYVGVFTSYQHYGCQYGAQDLEYPDNYKIFKKECSDKDIITYVLLDGFDGVPLRRCWGESCVFVDLYKNKPFSLEQIFHPNDRRGDQYYSD